MISSRCINLHLILTVVDCRSLNAPANGGVTYTSGTTFGNTTTYSCNTGYNLVGNSVRTCQATRNWSGSAPACQGMLVKDYFHMCIDTRNITICICSLRTY